MLGLRFCAWAFSSCGKWGPLFIAVRGPLTIAASLVAEHKLQTRRLSSCGSQAQLLRGMWGPPRPGLEPVSPALAGRLSTTAPPGKPSDLFLLHPNSGICGHLRCPLIICGFMLTSDLRDNLRFIYLFIFKINLFIHSFIHSFIGCIGSLLLHAGFL